MIISHFKWTDKELDNVSLKRLRLWLEHLSLRLECISVYVSFLFSLIHSLLVLMQKITLADTFLSKEIINFNINSMICDLFCWQLILYNFLQLNASVSGQRILRKLNVGKSYETQIIWYKTLMAHAANNNQLLILNL